MADTAKASQKWSDLLARRAAPGRESWFYAIDHPRLRSRIYGDYLGGLDPFSWVRSRVACPIPRALEIGCGDGGIALGLMQAGWFKCLDAFDVAEGAIASAQAQAAAAGFDTLRFLVRDGDTLTLEPGAYDFIYANHALHHITNLEHLFAQCAAALRPGGMLFASDYVGPSRMQYSDAHLMLMNDMLARLPPEKRWDNLQGYQEKRLIQRTPLQAFLDHDPSEAPRSAEIIPTLEQFFDVEAASFGMELTYEVLLGIVHNFDPDDGGDNALIDAMTELDRAAARDGIADRLFANIVARPREPAAAVPVLLPTGMGGPPSDFPALLGACIAPRVAPDAVAAIDGWLSPEAADLTIRLCRLQAALGIRTGVLELGVYRGKYLALLGALHAGMGLPLVGVDLFIERIGQPVAAEHIPHIVAGITASVVGAAPGVTPPLIMQARTRDMDVSVLQAHCIGGYSFVSVDAGHEADDVASDMALAASVLSQGGIVALDDAFNPALPGVADGLFRYFGAAEDFKLAPFATCGNKLFLCRPEMHETYLAYAAWLLTQGHDAEYLAKSRERDLGNRSLLFIPRLSGREIVAFDYGAASVPAVLSAG
ncbi:MAG TPA: methyltransferase domain-containing protein [Acetobacteraceae bacterium]